MKKILCLAFALLLMIAAGLPARAEQTEDAVDRLLDQLAMYFDLRDCPYARAESEEQLYALLGDIDALIPNCAKVRAFYGVTETGRSAIAERLD